MKEDKFSGSVRLHKELVKKIDEHVKSEQGKKIGYKSRADFINKAIQELIKEETGKELEDINTFEDHALIGTKDRTDLACIFFRNGKPWCDKDNSTTCRHAVFALTVPKILEKLERGNWKNEHHLSNSD